MKIVAVISEYNPFHLGHALLFRRIRERLGQDTAILAIMSGNYVQRGEPAVMLKLERAKSAVRGGADLVLELPFPHACSSAERFARAGVHIANALGCVDFLAFGSECGEIAPLLDAARIMESDAYQAAYDSLSKQQTVGSAEKATLAYVKAGGKDASLFTPNNVLGIEYLRALLRKKSNITPITFPREGAEHDAREINKSIASASAIRALLYSGDQKTALTKMPPAAALILQNALDCGVAPVAPDRLLDYAFLYYRLCNAADLKDADGLGDGLGDRFINAAWNCMDATEFFEAIRTKRYTDAYLRRAMLYGLFSVTREQLNAPPTYTQVLAMTGNGQKILAKARKTATLPILTKPADYKQLNEAARAAAERSLRADSLYCALLPHPSAPRDLLRYSPHREE